MLQSCKAVVMDDFVLVLPLYLYLTSAVGSLVAGSILFTWYFSGWLLL
jgi:hypothetical protein